APVVAPASIDEWYLDLAGTEALYGGEPLAATAQRIRRAVAEETGLTVSIGGGTNRLVAKLAVELAKPHKAPRHEAPGHEAPGHEAPGHEAPGHEAPGHEAPAHEAPGERGGGAPDDEMRGGGAYVVPPGGEGAFVARLTLAELPLVGPKLQERLARAGMRTVADALRHDVASLERLLGERTGRWLHERVRGIDATPVEPRDEAKSMSREETFDRDLHEDGAIERELARLAVRVSADLRGDGLVARTVTVKVRDSDFVTRQASRTLDRGIESERAVATVARELLRRLRRARRVGVRLLGVSLSQLGDDAAAAGAAGGQLALFEDARPAAKGGEPPVETERDRELSRVVDRIREKFGTGAIVPGDVLGE
ncbi:MAG: DNA polymerase thumb domain-containing protein, partial [Gemmatimonadaceae bacterium]